jgi:transcriptional regulator with XRE-family HTH domain
MMLEDIATQVSEARQHKGLSLETLAEVAQLSTAELIELEAGNADQILEWPVLKVKKLADALEISLSQLMGERILAYDQWALVWSALIEYSANRPGLNMKADMKDLIMKVRSFIPNQQINEVDG